jgi:hypothetical protein
MPVADPCPISTQPYVTGHRRDTDDFLSRRRRSHHHHAVGVVSLVWNYDTPRQSNGEQEAGDPTEMVRRHIGNWSFDIDGLVERTLPPKVDPPRHPSTARFMATKLARPRCGVGQ